MGDRARKDALFNGFAEVAKAMANGRRAELVDVLAVDVRPRAEYAAGHITGARSIPADRLARDLSALPADTEVVAYCRGPYCVFADDAVRLLRRRGRMARRLEDGFPECRHARLPIETSPGEAMA